MIFWVENRESWFIMNHVCQSLLWLMEVRVIFNIIWSFSSAVSFDRRSLWIFTSDAFTLTFLFHFVFIIFLFISWEFHIMSPEHTHFLVFVVPLTPLWHPTPCQIRRKIKIKSFNLCCPHMQWNMFKLSVANSLTKLSPSQPAFLPEAISCRELHFRIFKSSLWWFSFYDVAF